MTERKGKIIPFNQERVKPVTKARPPFPHGRVSGFMDVSFLVQKSLADPNFPVPPEYRGRVERAKQRMIKSSDNKPQTNG